MERLRSCDYGPFNSGDGRRKVNFGMHKLPGTQPVDVTYAQARQQIDRYRQAKNSHHSGQGATLWVILQWLHWHSLPYRLTAIPGEFYYVEHYDHLEHGGGTDAQAAAAERGDHDQMIRDYDAQNKP